MALETARDLAIVILAILAILQLLVLLVLTIAIYVKVVPLIEKVGRLMDSAQTTASTVAGTSIFVGQAVVSPIIRVASFVAGLRKGVSTLGRLVRRKGTTA